jgi:dihydrodipicolinate synthase/N-acetylneuraminate lyase
VPLSDGLIASLKHCPNLAGVKDSGGDMAGYVGRVMNFPDPEPSTP